MSNYLVNLNTLSQRITQTLEEEINTSSCYLLDVPNYYNPGDQLIYLGEIEILKRISKTILYESSSDYFNSHRLNTDDCILLQGGGNFGDLYYKHQVFREYIITKYLKNKIIFLPSSIFFRDHSKFKQCVNIFSNHPRLVIIARDNYSFSVVKRSFTKNKCYLLPDMALGIKSLHLVPKSKTKRVLILVRMDKEKEIKYIRDDFSFISDYEITDWKGYNMHSMFYILNRIINSIVGKGDKLLHLSVNQKSDVYGRFIYQTYNDQILTAVSFLKEFNLIITNRLHGHILSCLLGLPNILIDNNNGKNEHFYKTWMARNSLCSYYARNVIDVNKILSVKFSHLLRGKN